MNICVYIYVYVVRNLFIFYCECVRFFSFFDLVFVMLGVFCVFLLCKRVKFRWDEGKYEGRIWNYKSFNIWKWDKNILGFVYFDICDVGY